MTNKKTKQEIENELLESLENNKVLKADIENIKQEYSHKVSQLERQLHEKPQSPIKTVKIRGKDYETVASRIERFRRRFSDWNVKTEIVSNTEKSVIVRCIIENAKGKQIASAHSCTLWSAKSDCTIEDCETSAIGRALGFALAGFCGDNQIATADEVQNKSSFKSEFPYFNQPKKTVTNNNEWINEVIPLKSCHGATWKQLATNEKQAESKTGVISGRQFLQGLENWKERPELAERAKAALNLITV